MGHETSGATESILTFMRRLSLEYAVNLLSTDDAAQTYRVRFTCNGRELDIEYEDFDENEAGVVARDALDEAASDASCVENSSNLWEWCQEYYGLEPHNPIIPDPEETYLVQQRRAKDLRAFLGDEEYHHLLFGVGRLFQPD